MSDNNAIESSHEPFTPPHSRRHPLAYRPEHCGSGAQACEFNVVKEQIDLVLDRDARLGAEFRAQVKDGSDSVAVIESLVTAEMREKVDVCRFYVAEYLTKRGFPPPH